MISPEPLTKNFQTRELSTKPVLRWAGSKSNLLPFLSKLLPLKFSRYVDPMVGGGSLFFHLSPGESLLADSNEELINFYQVLKTKYAQLESALSKLKASKRFYYELRAKKPTGVVERAVRFAYLNRLCWNGLYRVNRKGEFNVPMGDRLPSILRRDRDFRLTAKSLQRSKMMIGDFAETLKKTRRGDFVFLDPPYPKGSSENLGFNRYSPDQFHLIDHMRLAECVRHLMNRTIKVMLTIADTPSILSLYPAELERHYIASKSLISCNGDTRGKTSEIILRNYEN